MAPRLPHRPRVPVLVAALVFLVAAAGCGTPTSSPRSGAPGGSNGASASGVAVSPSTLPALTPTPTPVPGGLYVDASKDLGPISKYVFGTNYGPSLFVTLDRYDDVKAAKFSVISFPGGNFGDNFDLSEQQLDSFVAFCRQVGAEPRIVARLKGGSAQAAADMVRYVNVAKGYKVRFWAVGNEPNLYPDMDLATYTKQWREFATAMKAVDPTIELSGPDISQFVASPQGENLTKATEWLRAFLKANGDMVTTVTIHRYPFPNNAEGQAPSADDLRANTKEWDETIPALRKIVREETGKDLPIGVTEINSSWSTNSGGSGTMESHMNGIWFGDVLGRMIRGGVSMVTQYAIIGQFGLMSKYQVYPIYYPYLMYQHFGTERVVATSDDPMVSIYGSKTADGRTAVMIVNLGSAPATKKLMLAGGGEPKVAEAWLFDKDHKAVKVDSPVAGGSVTLPPESMTALVLQ